MIEKTKHVKKVLAVSNIKNFIGLGYFLCLFSKDCQVQNFRDRYCEDLF